MPANLQRPKPPNYSADLHDGRRDLQADAHFFFDTLFAGRSVLDVGAGHGISKERVRHNYVTTYDVDARLAPFVDHAGPEMPSGAWDVVTAFDVIEHVEDDVAFARALDARARDAVFFTTPNWYVHECRSTHHWREYTAAEMFSFALAIWPEELVRLCAFYKDRLGGWWEVLPRDAWERHAGLKHGVLVLKSQRDRARLDVQFNDRWNRALPPASRRARAVEGEPDDVRMVL